MYIVANAWDWLQIHEVQQDKTGESRIRQDKAGKGRTRKARGQGRRRGKKGDAVDTPADGSAVPVQTMQGRKAAVKCAHEYILMI